MECDWKDIRSVRALLVHITQLHLPSFCFIKSCGLLVTSHRYYILLCGGHQVSKGIRRSTVECDWKNTGGYWSGAEVIDIRIPQLHPLGKHHIVSLGVACALSCSLTERSTEEETPIDRAVSGSLCVCELCTRPTFINLQICCEFTWPFGKRG